VVVQVVRLPGTPIVPARRWRKFNQLNGLRWIAGVCSRR
jgi:hypothetical protein